MAVFFIILLFIWGGYEAIQHYNAEKYARNKVYGEGLDFFGFMLSEHPIISIVVIILVIGFVLFALGVGQ